MVLILALLVVLLGVSGFFGLKLYSEAKQVKAHEEQAMQLLGGVTDLSNLDNLDTVKPADQPGKDRDRGCERDCARHAVEHRLEGTGVRR